MVHNPRRCVVFGQAGRLPEFVASRTNVAFLIGAWKPPPTLSSCPPWPGTCRETFDIQTKRRTIKYSVSTETNILIQRAAADLDLAVSGLPPSDFFETPADNLKAFAAAARDCVY
jgi:hypothetical protein